jgi:hypothetical protein
MTHPLVCKHNFFRLRRVHLKYRYSGEMRVMCLHVFGVYAHRAIPGERLQLIYKNIDIPS